MACFLFATWNIVRIALAPLSTIVQYVPDDAFYYLEISRNLGLLGKPSFDGGQTLTTGFHPLWAWISECVGSLNDYHRMGMLRAMIVISGVVSLAVAAAAGHIAWRKATTMLPVVSLLLTSFSYLNNSGAATEWCLVTLISAAALWLLLRLANRMTAWSAASLAMLGALGSLARTDFGGQGLGYLAAALLVWMILRERRYVLPALTLLVGGCAGLAMAMWYDHSTSGSWLKGSAHMKELWGAAWGISPLPFFLVLARTVLYLPGLHRSLVANLAHTMPGHRSEWPHVVELLAVTGLIVVVLTCWPLIRETLGAERSMSDTRGFFIGASSVLIFLLYAVVYSLNSIGMQAWYTANLTIAVGALLSLGMSLALNAGWARTACAAAAVVTIANLALFMASKPFAYDQAGILGQAQQAKEAFGAASLGVSDAGIFNFVYGGRVINLDGLANDEIVRYAPGRLPCYLADKHIAYFNGFGGSSAAFPMEPVTAYATAVPLSLERGPGREFFRVDEAKVRALPECGR